MKTLSSDEIDELLSRNGVGVLSMYDGTRPYAIPMSFGYDGSTPVFAMQLGSGDESRKQNCLETTSQVAFTVYEQTDADRWRSVVISGEFSPIPDEEADTAMAALADNADFASDVGLWGVPMREAELTLYELEIEECDGREFSMADAP